MKKYLVIASALLLLIACKSKTLQPITKVEAIAFAEKIEKGINNGNGAVLDSTIDFDMIADEVVKISGNSNKSSLKKGLKQGWEKNKLGVQIVNNLGESGTYEFVREYEKEGHPHIIFRMYSDNGLNYHDFDLIKYNNEVHIKDVFIYLTGENISITMANTLNTAMRDHSETILNLRTLFQQKEYATAKKAYESLPPTVQKDKLVQLVYLEIASQLDNETYTKALAGFEKLYGNEPSVQLALLDVYFMNGDYDRAIKAVNEIDATTQDPFLDYYRGLLYNQKGDAAQSTAMLERLYKNKPTFEDGIVELISNYINDKEYKRADTLINTYKHNTSFNQEKLSNLRDLYPDDDSNVNW